MLPPVYMPHLVAEQTSVPLCVRKLTGVRHDDDLAISAGAGQNHPISGLSIAAKHMHRNLTGGHDHSGGIAPVLKGSPLNTKAILTGLSLRPLRSTSAQRHNPKQNNSEGGVHCFTISRMME